jgi:NTE family protein
VLDRLLEEPGLEIEGISGTSAGAMSACALAQGLIDGGKNGARAELEAFWHFNPYQTSAYQALARAWNLDWTPASLWLDLMAQFVSPYQLGAADRNPLRDLLLARFDFERLRLAPTRLFVCATNLTTNRMRIFENEELSVETLLASSCLPQLHRAVEIEGEFYWDGGFIGNPVLKPLIPRCSARDIILVQINPIRREKLPITSRDTMDLNEVTMNAALMRELEVVATISRLVREGRLKDSGYDDIRLHQIADHEVMGSLGVRSKNNTALAFLVYLRDAGRACAERWLEANRSRIGRESTLDLEEFTV